MPPKIFIVADWYLPGYKAGGQVTAVVNLVEMIGNSFELFMFTRERDLTESKSYPGIRQDEWVTVGKARVIYTRNLSSGHLRRRIREIRPEIIYLNSVFSTLAIKVLCLRKLQLLPEHAVVLSPRGEFSAGALGIKALRKSLFVNCAARAGLYRDVIWQASSDLERAQIVERLKSARIKHQIIHVAPDAPSQEWLHATKGPPRPAKSRGARFLFMSRVSRMKNLLFAIEAMGALSGSVEFDIFGPLDDRGYWQECLRKIRHLPTNVTVRYRGTIPHNLVLKVARDYHFFVLPTRGENFGYAILEAMAAGCPVILSDRTPWQEAIKQGTGWGLPLEESALWRRVLQHCVDMQQCEYAIASSKAREFVEAWAASANRREETIRLFNAALGRTALPALTTSLHGAPRELRD